MSNYSKIYWLTRLDYLQHFFIVVGVILFIVLIIHFVIMGVTYDTDDIVLLKGWKRNGIIISIAMSSLFACFIPTRNEAILIMAGGKTIDFIQSDSSINKIPGQTTAIITNFLDKQIKSLKESK